MRGKLVAALLMGIANSTAVAADIDERSEAILKRTAAAVGTEPREVGPVLTTVGTFHVAGLEGPIEIVEDTLTGRFRASLDLGVLKQLNGFDGTTPWIADASGIVDPQESKEAVRESINAAYLARRAFASPDAGGAEVHYLRQADESGRIFDVLSVKPEGGSEAELWIDQSTGLPDRWVERDAASTETTRFEDYRSVRGINLPFRKILSDGNPRNDQMTVVDRYTFGPSPSVGMFVRPRSEITDAFVGEAGTESPIELEAGHIVISASINGSEPLPFILDSGASINVLTPGAARQLGIETAGDMDAEGVGERRAGVSFARVDQVTVGEAKLTDQQFAVLALPALLAHRGGKKPIAGVLGYDMLRRFVTRIDYAGRRIHLDAIRQCPATRNANELPIVFSDRIPEVEARIDGVKGLWSVDTGASGELTLFGGFVEAHGLDAGRPTFFTTSAGGVGGEVSGRLSRFTSFQIGPFQIERPYGEFAEAQAGAFSSSTLAGNIGSNTLGNFVVTLDYECRTLNLEKGAAFGGEETINRAGFTFTKMPRAAGLEILHVRNGGPAEAAGVRAGDILLAINGEPVQNHSYGSAKDELGKAPGTEVAVLVERGGKQLDLIFKLADPFARP